MRQSERKKKLLWLGTLLLMWLIPAVRGGILCIPAALGLGGLLVSPLNKMEEKGISRWLGGAFLLILAAAIGLTTAYLLLSGLCDGISGLMEQFSDGNTVFLRLDALSDDLPHGIGTLLKRGVQYFSQKSEALPSYLAAQGASLSKKAVKLLPQKLLFLFITALAAYYAAVDWEEVHSLVLRTIPQDWQPPLFRLLSSLRGGFLRWLRVQGSLALMQLCLLTAGFYILKVYDPLFYGALTAAADALPLLGTGVVLLPWTAVLWLMGDGTAAGMLVLWVLSWSLRAVMEPRLVGHQAGVSPFFTVTGMYLGLRCFGVKGMIAAAVIVSAFGNRNTMYNS